MRTLLGPPACVESSFCFLSLFFHSFAFFFSSLPLSFSYHINLCCQRICSPPPTFNNQQQLASSSSQVSFLLTGLLPPHRFPILFNLFLWMFLNVYGCLWMFMDVFWMAFWNFDLFHTGPRVGTHTTSHKAQWYLIYTLMNTIIMISASTCNNLISFHLYVYIDKFLSSHQQFLPTYSFDRSVALSLSPSSFFSSFHNSKPRTSPDDEDSPASPSETT